MSKGAPLLVVVDVLYLPLHSIINVIIINKIPSYIHKTIYFK